MNDKEEKTELHDMSDEPYSYVGRAIRSLTPTSFLKYLIRRHVAGELEWGKHVDDYAIMFYKDMEPECDVEIWCDEFHFIIMRIGVQKAVLRMPVWYGLYEDNVIYVRQLGDIFRLLHFLGVAGVYRDDKDWAAV